MAEKEEYRRIAPEFLGKKFTRGNFGYSFEAKLWSLSCYVCLKNIYSLLDPFTSHLTRMDVQKQNTTKH